MKKLLMVIVVLVVLVAVYPREPSWSDRSVVEITGYGSGVVVAPTLVLTAKHVAEIGGLVIDGQPVVETTLDPDSDVALLRVEKPLDRPVAKIMGYDLKPGDEVMVVGTGFGLPVAQYRGRVILVNIEAGPWPVAVITDCHAEPGCSGGAVVYKGRVVAIHVGHNDLIRVEVPVKEILDDLRW